MAVDLTKLKLGCKPARFDRRTLQFTKYADLLPAPPPAIDWLGSVTSWGELDNDVLGDCTCAAVGHAVQIAAVNLVPPQSPDLITDPLILELYEKSCGYVPGDPSTDQGGVIIDVLNYVRQNQIGKRHHKLKLKLFGYVQTNITNIEHVKQAIATFGVVDIGISLPLSAQAQTQTGIWDVVGNPSTDPNSAPNSWGGHSVAVAAYDADGLTCITWGFPQRMTWAFWLAYSTEAYPLLLREWIERYQSDYPQVLAQLGQDLQEVSN